MNIPERLKIGGKIYTVEKTDKLEIGDRYMGECLYTKLTMRIVPCKAKTIEEITFLHEIGHAILNHLGYTNHNEKKIDEVANAVHMIIIDNPNIFEMKTSEQLRKIAAQNAKNPRKEFKTEYENIIQECYECAANGGFSIIIHKHVSCRKELEDAGLKVKIVSTTKQPRGVYRPKNPTEFDTIISWED